MAMLFFLADAFKKSKKNFFLKQEAFSCGGRIFRVTYIGLNHIG